MVSRLLAELSAGDDGICHSLPDLHSSGSPDAAVRGYRLDSGVVPLPGSFTSASTHSPFTLMTPGVGFLAALADCGKQQDTGSPALDCGHAGRRRRFPDRSWSIAHRARITVETRYECGGVVAACALPDEFFRPGGAGARIRRSYCLVCFGTAVWLALLGR